MTTPSRLYKYQPPTVQAITNLSDARLWFSNPTHFNDPFDCALDVSIADFTEDDARLFLDKIAPTPQIKQQLHSRLNLEDVRKRAPLSIRQTLKRVFEVGQGVCCFSELVDSLLMWGHYADGHRGFCLEFATTGDPLKSTFAVSYCDEFPTLQVKDLFPDNPETVQTILKGVLTKSTWWSYEKEWRALHGKAGTAYGYDRRLLTGVYFGAQMPDNQRQLLGSILSHTNTKLYQMNLSKSRFKLEAEPVTFTRIDYKTGSAEK
jgi:hypothetical protein